MKEIRPIGDRLLIKTEEQESVTSSGIIIPESAKGKPQRGVVITISETADTNIKKGDRIMFGKFAGTEVEMDKQKYLIINITDVLVVL